MTRFARVAVGGAVVFVAGAACLVVVLESPPGTPVLPTVDAARAEFRAFEPPGPSGSDADLVAVGRPADTDARPGEVHIGKHLDPEARWHGTNAKPRHLGAYLDPDEETPRSPDAEVSHVGAYLDPEDARAEAAGSDEPSHVGSFLDPDGRGATGEAVSHVGELLTPDAG